jgi:tetratricopeptide (TPR) repeat protein
MGEYPKALVIQQQSLRPNHSDLATSYNNIGVVYEKMGNYSKACSSYEREMEIAQKSLPPNHPALQNCRKKLADMKKKL